ncbi:MAG: 4-amino-4-deoxy-L-arabinose transferase [bacterium]
MPKSGERSTTAYKLLLVAGVVINSGAQLLMKQGVNSMGGVTLAGGAVATEIAGIFTNPYVLAGLCAIAVSLLIWLHVISRLDLSFAYPFVSISYILILLAGWLVFGEHATPARAAGVILIGAGVIIISRTER